jgi:hypothetical protein
MTRKEVADLHHKNLWPFPPVNPRPDPAGDKPGALLLHEGGVHVSIDGAGTVSFSGTGRIPITAMRSLVAAFEAWAKEYA